MISSETLKEIILSNAEYIHTIERIQGRSNLTLPDEKTRKVVVFYGVRRSGKTRIGLVFENDPKRAPHLLKGQSLGRRSLALFISRILIHPRRQD